jgi:hypothetical protein
VRDGRFNFGTSGDAAATPRDNAPMKVELVAFGELEIEGERYRRDVVIDAGRISKRDKGPSKALPHKGRHTPLTVAEQIPWGGKRLIIGTGAHGQLPIAPGVAEEAIRRGIAIEALPTSEACRLLADIEPADVFAILHLTC